MNRYVLFFVLLCGCNRDCPPPPVCPEQANEADLRCQAAFGPTFLAREDTRCGGCRELADVSPWQAQCDGEATPIVCCEGDYQPNDIDAGSTAR